MEHRWGDRRPVILPVRLFVSDQKSATGWLTDISLSGAYVKTRKAFPLLSRIEIAFDEGCHGLTGRGAILLQGRIVRHGSTGLGVEWEKFAPQDLGDIVRVATSIQRPRSEHTCAQDCGIDYWAPAVQEHIGS